jgi:hypothetical protein
MGLLNIILGIVILAIISVLIIVSTWYIETTFYQPLINYDRHRHFLVYVSIERVTGSLGDPIFYFPFRIANVVYDLIQTIRDNIFNIIFFIIAFTAMVLLLNYHDSVFYVYIIVRQCVFQPVMNIAVLPILNIGRFAINLVLGVFNFLVDLYAFYQWGVAIIFFKCAAHTDIGNILSYAGAAFSQFATDTKHWLESGFLDNDYTILQTLEKIGYFIDSLVPPLDCFCRLLGSVYRAISMWFQLHSLHTFIDCTFNFIIRIIQIPINSLIKPERPNFEHATTRFCCAIVAVGTTFEDTIYIIAEFIWGLLTQSEVGSFPSDLEDTLSLHYTQILTRPICAAGNLINMTLVLAVQFDRFLFINGTTIDSTTVPRSIDGLPRTDTSPIIYFQFGKTVIDELNIAADEIGNLFIVFGNDARVFISKLLRTIVNFFGFLIEWIIGSVVYFIWGGPLFPYYPKAPYQHYGGGSFDALNFVRYYFPNYFLQPSFDNTMINPNYKFSTALDQMFKDARYTVEAFGNIIGKIFYSPAIGHVVEYTFVLLIDILYVMVNIIAFIWPISTFQSEADGLFYHIPSTTSILTTFKQVNTDQFFIDAGYLTEAIGNSFRQFDYNNCTFNASTESHKTLMCCLGNFSEQFLDVFVYGLQQLIWFFQDLVTLPTQYTKICLPFDTTIQNRTTCIRIPDLTSSLDYLDASICDLACALFSFIPTISFFQCHFKTTNEIPYKTCGMLPTCGSSLLCEIVKSLTIPLHLINIFIKKILSGTKYADYTDFIEASVSLLVDRFATAIELFGITIDCMFCSFKGGSRTQCDNPTYDTL